MLNRRRFLAASSAAVLAGCSKPAPTPTTEAEIEIELPEVPEPTDPNAVRIALIGVSNRGADNLKGVMGERIVALCDIDESKATKARQQFRKAHFFTDYRTMLDRVGKDIDAVVISTPDHTHAHATLAAIALGKHVYCEKPLCHTVEEVRRVMAAAAAKKVVTQMGTQIHAMDNYRRAVEIVQSGKLGAVKRVHAWCSRRPDPARVVRRLDENLRFDTDLWCGPVSEELFLADHPEWPHFHWRWWWPFGGGVLSDMGCHFLDLPFWALGLGSPATVKAIGTAIPNADNTVPQTMQVDYTFPAAKDRAGVHLTWYHGVPGPNLDGTVKYPNYFDGVLFEGEGGKKMLVNYHDLKLLPDEFAKDFKAPPATIAKSKGHHREWIDAIRGDGKTLCPFGYSGPLTETVLLGNVAYRAGADLKWDAAKGTSDSKEANALLGIEPRKGWEWPA